MRKTTNIEDFYNLSDEARSAVSFFFNAPDDIEVWSARECLKAEFGEEVVEELKEFFGDPGLSEAHKMAIKFHNTYESLAPQYGYVTNPATRKFDHLSANGKLMIATCQKILVPE